MGTHSHHICRLRHKCCRSVDTPDVTGGSATLAPMMTSVAAIGATITGAVLALVAVVGGVTAVTPGANSAAKSEQVVFYDAP